MYDENARLIRTENVSGSTIYIERKNLSSGMYFYKLVDPKGKFANGKLIVQ
jgi:hypothetical protein